jgi:hypothetical protein
MLIRQRRHLTNSRDTTSTPDPSASTTRLPEIPTPVPAADAVALVADVVAVVVEAEVSAVVVEVEVDSVVVVVAVEVEAEDSVEAVVAAVEEEDSKARKLHSKQCTCGIGGAFQAYSLYDPVAFTLSGGFRGDTGGFFFSIC